MLIAQLHAIRKVGAAVSLPTNHRHASEMKFLANSKECAPVRGRTRSWRIRTAGLTIVLNSTTSS